MLGAGQQFAGYTIERLLGAGAATGKDPSYRRS